MLASVILSVTVLISQSGVTQLAIGTQDRRVPRNLKIQTKFHLALVSGTSAKRNLCLSTHLLMAFMALAQTDRQTENLRYLLDSSYHTGDKRTVEFMLLCVLTTRLYLPMHCRLRSLSKSMSSIATPQCFTLHCPCFMQS